MAKHPAAFINALSEMRDFRLAIESLQETWDKLQDSYEQRGRLRHALMPFARLASEFDDPSWADNDEIELNVSDHLFARLVVADFRRAHALLAQVSGTTALSSHHHQGDQS